MFHSFLLTFTRGYLDISIFMRKMQCLTFFWFKYLKIPFVFPHVWGKAVLSFHKMVRIFLSHQRCDSWFFCFPSRSGAPFQWIRWWSREVLTSRGENSVTNMALICSQYERGFLMGFLYGYYIYIYIWDFYPSWDFHYQQYDMWICGLFWKCWGKNIVKNIMKKPWKLPGKSCM